MDFVLQGLFIFGLLTCGFLLAGFAFWYKAKRFIDKSEKAKGVVIKVKKIPFEDRGDTFSPVVRFRTNDGRALSFTDAVSRYPAEFEVGEQTDVLYDPENPHNARAVKNISDLFLLAKMFGVAGAAVIASGLVMGIVFGFTNRFPGSF
jgi:hypothetical protein